MPKRDFERIREILLHLENHDSDDGYVWTRNDPFYRQSDNYQFTLMVQAGFITGTDYLSMAGIVPDRVQITFNGHDYLNAIRDEGIWSRTKTAVAETGGSATLELLKNIATGFVKKKLSQHTGLDL